MTRTRPTLLLIHGFPQDHRLWDPQVDAFSGSTTVLAPDLRGFGRPADLPEVLTMDSFAADLKAFLDEQGVERVVLCGLSMGGYVALAFMARWPERVQGLILCHTRATADTAEGKEAREATAKDALERGVAVIARAMLPRVLSAGTRRDRPELVARVEAMMAGQDPRAVAAASRGMAQRPDRMAMLPSIAVPTLIIAGEEDELMPLPGSKAMADAIPDSELVVLPGAAHLGNLEAAELFNAAVLRFLQRMPAG